MIIILVAAFTVFLLAQVARAQDKPENILGEAKELFTQKKFGRALTKFKLALQMEPDKKAALEAAFYIGAIYAEMGESELAKQNLRKYVTDNPVVETPKTFSETMTKTLEEVRSEFPIAGKISVEKDSFKPYREQLGISFEVKAAKSVIEQTKVTVSIVSEARQVTLLDSQVTLDASQPVQLFNWDGKSKYGSFLENGEYVLTVVVVREDGWKHSAQYPVIVGGNLQSQEIVALAGKAQRFECLSGQIPVDYMPGKRFLKIGKEPLKASTIGIWNYVYYIPLGAIRDILDFPVKFLFSLKGVGHVLTIAAPFVGSYQLGRSIWKLDRAEYYDPVWGYDESAWDHDKGVVEKRALTTAALAPAWVMAYAGLMSIVSWAGTEDGIGKGFMSYIDSNAYRNGYDWKYFFPNYRSLDFSTVRVDQKKLKHLEGQIRLTNKSIQLGIDAVNREVDDFNRNKLVPFKQEISEKYNKELHERAVMTVKGKKK